MDIGDIEHGGARGGFACALVEVPPDVRGMPCFLRLEIGFDCFASKRIGWDEELKTRKYNLVQWGVPGGKCMKWKAKKHALIYLAYYTFCIPFIL